MSKTTLYLVRHGKTMFNTLGRAQGWCDSPLTAKGRQGIEELGAGFKAKGLTFKQAFTSDSGRTIETLGVILGRQGQLDLPHTIDPRVREWCFGSMEGLHDQELFMGVLPRTAILAEGQTTADLTYPELAASLVQVDTAGWAQPWEVIRERLLTAVTDMAETIDRQGGGNGLVVSHGMSIASLVWLLDPERPRQHIDNGSVTVLSYNQGAFGVETVADLSYRELGREVLGHETT